MTYQHIVVSIDRHIARVQLHRPPVNAFNKELVGELVEVANYFKVHDDVWIVVVTASGKSFCAGADLKERAGVPQDQVMKFVSGIQSVVASWCNVPQPVIVGIQGAALGGGLEFALAGDIIVASDSATLGLPETSLGIIPAAGGTQRLTQRTSAGIAKKWILTGRHFSAEDAKEDGVVDFLLPSGTFDSEFENIVQQIASNAPLALRQAKAAIESSYGEWLSKGFEKEKILYQPLIATNDRIEALTAFMEKRKPVWKGK